jgi:hypothetical protein
MDATFSALVNQTIAFLRSQPEQSADRQRIHDHLSDSLRVLNIAPYLVDMWGRPFVVKEGIVWRVLHTLMDHLVVERVREGRGYVYALTDERKWQAPTW